METSIRVPATGTFDQAVTPLSTFWFMVLHDTLPETIFLSALQLLSHRSSIALC